MTTYTAITATEVDADSPVTDTLMQRLRDNPLAMFEGAAGAPRLQLAAVDTWFMTAGGIGTYCFANATADVAFGGTVAGSSLTPTSAARGGFGGTTGNGNADVGAALSGTWRAMGTFDQTWTTGGTMTPLGATLWMRIA